MKLYGVCEDRPRAALTLEEGVQIVGAGPRVRVPQLLPDGLSPDELFQAEVAEGGLTVTALSGETITAPDGRKVHRAAILPSQSFAIGGWRFAISARDSSDTRLLPEA